jgi:hypothetical protein
MKFKNLIGDIGSHIKKEIVTRKTQRAVDRYRNSGEVKYPRIYGYRQTPEGVEIVQNEAKVVRIILGLLVLNKTPEEIRQDLLRRDIRNRSGNRFTTDEIKTMAKPVYAGLIMGKNGRLTQSKHYEPIVSLEVLKRGQKALNKVSKGANGTKFSPPQIGERLLLTSTEGERCQFTKWDFLGLP